jgi:multiple antibiotic resistance protein
MSFLIKDFLTLFVVIDPIGLLPLYMLLVSKYPVEEQSRIASKAVLVAALILLVFAFAGNWLLRYLGITMEAFQVGAGILLLKIAIDMVFAHLERETPEEEKEAQLRNDVSVFPLAVPLLAGPGSFASVLILSSETDIYPYDTLIVLSVAAIVLLITYLLFRLSEPLSKVLGQTGINVVTRIFGILLTALAIQYIADGSTVLLKTALQ